MRTKNYKKDKNRCIDCGACDDIYNFQEAEIVCPVSAIEQI